MAKKCNAVEIELDLLCSIITPNREDRMQFLMQTLKINNVTKHAANVTNLPFSEMTMSGRLLSMSPCEVFPSIQGLRTWASTPAASLLSSSPFFMSDKVFTITPLPWCSRNLLTMMNICASKQSRNFTNIYLIIPSRTQQMEPKALSAEILTSNCVSPLVQSVSKESTAPYCTSRRHRLLPSRARLVITLSDMFSSDLATPCRLSTHVLIWTPSISSTTREKVDPISVISLMRGTFWVSFRTDNLMLSHK